MKHTGTVFHYNAFG